MNGGWIQSFRGYQVGGGAGAAVEVHHILIVLVKGHQFNPLDGNKNLGLFQSNFYFKLPELIRIQRKCLPDLHMPGPPSCPSNAVGQLWKHFKG